MDSFNILKYGKYIVEFIKGLFGYKTSTYKSHCETEGFLKLKIGGELIRQLNRNFSDSTFSILNETETEIEVPLSLGKELYAAWIESLINGREIETERTYKLKREHGELLEELEKDGDRVNLLYLEENEISEEVESQCEIDGVNKSVEFYRQEAKCNLNKAKQLLKQANQCLKSSNNREKAGKYFREASVYIQKREQAESLAYEILKDNCFSTMGNWDCLDLHGFKEKEAIETLDEFINETIEELPNGRNQNRTTSVMVITGRGRHSPGGIPVLKHAVVDRLERRNLEYSETNPGLLKIKIRASSQII